MKSERRFAERYFPLTLKNIFLFLFIWGSIGFSVGTSTLQGPVRWLADFARARDYGPEFESWGVRIIILLLVVFTGWLSQQAVRSLLRSKFKHVKIGLPVLAFLGALLSFSLWLSPAMMRGGEEVKIEKGTRLSHSPSILRQVNFDPKTGILAASPKHPSQLLSKFIESAVPSIRSVILLGPIFLIYGILAGGFAGWLKQQKGIRTAYTRKVFHVFIFTMAGILHLFMGLSAVALFGSVIFLCVLYAVYRGDGFSFYEAMAREKDAPHRTLFIVIPLITTALGGVFANLFFHKFAFVAYMASGWGDAVGEPVGSRWGTHKYKVPSLAGVPAQRSVEGSLAVMFMSMLGVFLSLLLAHVPWQTALLVAQACGIATALIEAVSSHGLDNLTVQVAAAATASLLLG